MKKYIYQNKNYPHFSWDKTKIINILTQVALKQGKILGKMQQFGFDIQQEAMLNALTEEITKSSEIEGEILNSDQVRSSLAKHLNITLTEEITSSYHIEGVVETMMDAVKKYNEPLTLSRLFGWHASLFPTGYSGMYKINVGKFRDEDIGVVSNKGGYDIIHYEAPPPKDVSSQMIDFLNWINENDNENPLLKVAIAHLWFVIIHPFDDGNGRLTRTITEMLLARSENTTLRFYSMSAKIQKEKKEYYYILEQTTTGELDITKWLEWFFDVLSRSIDDSESVIDNVIKKAIFWQKNSFMITNKIQQDIINRLFDGFKGNLTSGKVEKIFKISQDTATRLLKDLVDKGILEVRGGGRSTHYVLK